MPLLLPLFLLLAILLAAPVSEARSQTSASPTLSELKDRVLAKSALLFDASTGKEIFARNPDTPFPRPAPRS